MFHLCASPASPTSGKRQHLAITVKFRCVKEYWRNKQTLTMGFLSSRLEQSEVSLTHIFLLNYSISSRKNIIILKKEKVLISCAGTVGRCVRFDGKPAYFQDSNIVWPRNNQNTYTNDFLYYILSKQNWRHLNTTTIIRIYNDDLRSLKFSHPSIEEQQKITSLLSAIDKRIATQNKIIEDLKKLKSAIIDGHFNGLKANCRIGELITEISQRNRRQESLPVLSVSNRSGFIAQSEQFGNRTIASEDTSNYKIVITNDFAFNPARINVGSIARLINYEKGIVSPMYICFRCKDGISSEYLDLFFKSRYFQTEVGKRLEGSVRQCLSIDGIKSIQIERIPMSQQMKWAKRLTTIESKLTIEENIYQLYKLQRKYLFIQNVI